MNWILDEDAVNLVRQRQRRVARGTAQFVEHSLPGVQSKACAQALLEYSIDCARIRAGELVLEFGVLEGGLINLIADAVGRSVRVFGFDSFAGLPESWRDGFDRGAFAMSKLPEVRPNVELVQGWFADTLPGFLHAQTTRVGFVHFDCDLYSSTREVLSLLVGRFRPGAVILFDEYFNCPGWEDGEFRALHDCARDHSLAFEYVGFNRHGRQVAIRVS